MAGGVAAAMGAIAAATWWLGGKAMAQQPGVQIQVQGQIQFQGGFGGRFRVPGRSTSDADGDAGDGVFLPIDRDTTRQWEKAKQLLDGAHYSDAVTLLDEILHRDEDFFFKPDGNQSTLSSLKCEAQRLIGSMPPEGVQAYELQFGARARQMLDEAVATGETTGLEELTRRYFHTQAGYEGMLLLGRHHLDHGQPLAAALCFQRLADSPQAAEQFEPELSIELACCYQRAGNFDRAREILVALKTKYKDSKTTINVAGKKVNLFSDDAQALAWLSTHFGEPPVSKLEELQNWQVYRGNASRNAQSVGGLPLLNPRWRVPTTTQPVVEKALVSLRQQFAEQNIATLPALHPLAVGNLILMPTARDLLAVDLESGKRLWPVRSGTDNSLEQMLAQSTSANGESRLDPASAALLTMRFWSDATLGTLASDGRQIYVIRDAASPGDQPQPFLQPGFGGRPRRGFRAMPVDAALLTNKLCASELRTQGKLKWEVGGASGEEEPKLAGAFFLGPPLPLQDKLYVLAEIKGEIKLCVLDPATGHLDWWQQLAVVEHNVAQDPFRRTAGCSPSFSDGVLVCPTSAGAVVAVDITNRSLLWCYLYTANSPFMVNQGMFPGGGMARNWDLNGPSGMERWADDSVTIANGRVLITPLESNELHCVNLADGKMAWSKPIERGDNLYVAGVHNGNVILVGKRQVTALKLADGKPAWKPKAMDLPPESMPSGRGYLSGDSYFLPLTSAEVVRIDLKNGSISAG